MANDQAQLELLREWRDNYNSELQFAKATVKRLQPIVQNLDDLIGSMEAIGGPPETQQASSVTAADSSPGIFTTLMKAFAIERKPPFASFTLIDAIGVILTERYKSSPSEPSMHANELVKAIFDFKTDDEFKRAKNSLAGELARGAERKLFEKTGPNEFRINPEMVKPELLRGNNPA